MAHPAHSASRVSKACINCRSKKRRCDGARPSCQLCIRLGVACGYSPIDGRSRRHENSSSAAAAAAAATAAVSTATGGGGGGGPAAASSSTVSPPVPSRPSPHSLSHSGSPHARRESSTQDAGSSASNVRSVVEATSGVMSAEMVSTQIGSPMASSSERKIAPWNLGLGYHYSHQLQHGHGGCGADHRRLQDILDWPAFDDLARSYFASVHPLYGTFDEIPFWRSAEAVWRGDGDHNTCLQFLFGMVAALGALFSSRTSPTMAGMPPSPNRISSTPDILACAEAHRGLHLLKNRLPVPDTDALILRTLHLRLTVGPQASYLSSCATVIVLEGAVIDVSASGNDNAGGAGGDDGSSQYLLKRTLIARLQNAWISNESARPRPFELSLEQEHYDAIARAPKTPSWDLIRLFEMSELLSPLRSPPDAVELEQLFRTCCDFQTNCDVVALSRTNLAVATFRRLRAHPLRPFPEIPQALIRVSLLGLEAVERLAGRLQPWHHVVNVPFQVLCSLLLLDTRESLMMVSSALSTLNLVADTFDTSSARTTLQIAHHLIGLAQQRKREDADDLSSALALVSHSDVAEPAAGDAQSSTLPMEVESVGNSSIANSLGLDFSKWDEIDWDQIFVDGGWTWDAALPEI